jgi:membrane-associated phospholipid phosphatase
VLVSFSVLYTGDHWLIDVVAGIAYAYVAFYLIVDSPAWLRVRTDRLWSAVTARLPRPGGSG